VVHAVIPATRKTAIQMIMVQGQPRQKVIKISSQQMSRAQPEASPKEKHKTASQE
jgi:hypothetical protein